jgi:hypothetical protein
MNHVEKKRDIFLLFNTYANMINADLRNWTR